MKTRILSLALALILVFSVITLPVHAATAKDVQAYLKSIAQEGSYSSQDQAWYNGFKIGSNNYGNFYFIIGYMESTKYVHMSIIFDATNDNYFSYEVTWKISSNPSPTYYGFVELYDNDNPANDTKGTVTLPAGYNGSAYTSFYSFTGNTDYKSTMLDLASSFMPGVVEFTRAVINDNDYALKDLGMTGYKKCDFVHAYDHGQVTKAPTCGTSGTMTYTCRVCGATATEEIEPTGDHSWDNGTVYTAATCTKNGIKRYTCTVCHTTRDETIPATGVHTWDAGVIVTEPTCTQPGLRRKTCSVCKTATLDETIPATGVHTWDAGVVVTEPTCTQPGLRRLTCSVCKTATFNEAIPALGHAWTLTEILNEAEEGGHASMGFYTCSRCNETKEARLCAAEVFTDMPKEGNWAHDPIDWAYFNGITAGKTDNSFAPKDTVTRAEAVSFLWRTLGKPEPTTEENPFTDVPEGKYYTLPVLWAFENGITSGTTETTFGPKDKCTRSQIMVFIWAAAGKPEPTLEENPFTDVPEGKSYTKAVLWAYENGITSGIDEGLYGPKNSCTRAQIVAFLYKALPFLTAHEEPEPEFLEWHWLSGGEMDRNDLGIGGADYLWVTVRGSQVPELSTDDPDVVQLSYEAKQESDIADAITYVWKVEVIGNGTAHINCTLDGEAVQALTIDCEAVAFRDAWWITDEGEDVPEEITVEDGAQAHLFVVMHYSEPIPGEDGMDPTAWELPTIYTDAPERLSLTLAALMPPSYVAAYDRGFLWNGTVSGSGPVHVFIELNGELVKTLTVNVP